MKVPFLDLKKMDLALRSALELKFSEMLDKGVFSGGEEVNKFESQVSAYLNSPFAISCANGTDALELALRTLEIGPGDEVIVPAMTWVSTAEVVLLVGAKPVFWDIDAEGLLAPDWVNAITPKTKAVIPVHLYGKMVDMGSLMTQARNHKLLVVEDGAQSFGAFKKGIAAGIMGDVGCLSFYPTKNLGALGEAGMCLTSSPNLNERLRMLLNHGQIVRDEHKLIGRNSRIDTLQAGFLNVMLDQFESDQIIRKKFAKLYLEGLADLGELQLPSGVLEEDHNAHLFVIQTVHRDELKEFLLGNHIGTGIHYPHILPDMEPFRIVGDFVNARKLSRYGLSLPLNPLMKVEEIELVIGKIKEFFSKK